MGRLSFAWSVEGTDYCKDISRLGRVQSRLVGSDCSQVVEPFPQATKKLETSTAVMYKDADHARTFRCCRGDVGQDYYRPPGSITTCVMLQRARVFA